MVNGRITSSMDKESTSRKRILHTKEALLVENIMEME
jgi:hypothetical protein